MVGVAINNNHCMPLHAHIRNEKKRFHKKQRLWRRGYHHYCGTWYGSHHGGLGHMFVNPRHTPNDMESNDDDKDEHLEGGAK